MVARGHFRAGKGTRANGDAVVEHKGKKRERLNDLETRLSLKLVAEQTPSPSHLHPNFNLQPPSPLRFYNLPSLHKWKDFSPQFGKHRFMYQKKAFHREKLEGKG